MKCNGDDCETTEPSEEEMISEEATTIQVLTSKPNFSTTKQFTIKTDEKTIEEFGEETTTKQVSTIKFEPKTKNTSEDDGLICLGDDCATTVSGEYMTTKSKGEVLTSEIDTTTPILYRV